MTIARRILAVPQIVVLGLLFGIIFLASVAASVVKSLIFGGIFQMSSVEGIERAAMLSFIGLALLLLYDSFQGDFLFAKLVGVGFLLILAFSKIISEYLYAKLSEEILVLWDFIIHG